ncbi:MAG: DUF6562 domain-containing protein, partial [Muribaculaceae bacterium]|nr:DUF6562 domain-containing protein [Muribaculaceae bacterium]
MKSIRYIQSTLIALMVLATTSCADDILPLGGGDEMVVTFRPTISNTMTRSIGDGSKINELVVGVYSDSGEKLIFTQEMEWNVAKEDDVNLTLIEGRKYKILFWAQCSDNSAYEVTNNGITVNYADYCDGGFAKMEELDAFCATATVTVGSLKIEDKGDISLSRPLAQVNFADNTTSPTPGSHKAVVTFTNVPTAFNPFTRKVTMSDASCTFTFTDFPTEPLMVDGATYYYVTDNYFFAPASIGATLDLQNADGTSIKTVVLTDGAIALEANKKTNVLGSIVQQPETWSVWDGEAKSQPAIDVQNRYIIDEASDIAWLADNGATLAENRTFLQKKDIDMASKTIKSIKLPAGSTYDGGGKTIKNFANSLFGDATSITVKDLTLEEIKITASSAPSHVGVLVNTLKGNSEFTNVSIANSSATTENGAAGGMVGYIVRISEKDRTEKLSVSFGGCKLEGVSISGTASVGKFVGLLSGYDNNESLSFDTDCQANNVDIANYVSMYAEGNKATWLADKDYTKFNGWLGNETYHRGTIYYGASNRFVPCWDGSTKITPLTEGSVKLIYSAFDLANLQGTNPGSIKFMDDVDLGLKVFNPLTNLTKLSGENKTIYRMKVETTFNTNSWDGGGFVRRCSAATIENITFKDADVKVTHVSGSDGDAYASIVCGTAEGTNTMTNVKVIGGKLYGCNKMGGIAGYITGTFTATNCIVDGLSIQNYDSGGKDKLGFKANGEVGGAFGFIAANSTITGCYVKNTTLNCVGVNNGKVLFKKYAGRHVNEFIGDIRTTSGQTISITLDEKNFTGNSYKNRKDQYSGCKYIGHCYYTYINALIAKIEDTKGTVYV